VKHIYFVAETKGSMSSLALRDTERAKIDCAKKFLPGWQNLTQFERAIWRC
jgi:restriction endonuclease